MRILVISASAWDDSNALGNTFSNWFRGPLWRDDKFSNFYMRNALPNNQVCTDFYRVTPQELLKKFMRPTLIGQRITYSLEDMAKKHSSRETLREQSQISWVHYNPNEFIYAGMEWLCRHRGWDNARFREYLASVSPEIVVAFLANNGMWKSIFACVKKYTHAKIVLIASDDMYGAAKTTVWYRRKKLVQDFEWCVKCADKLYGQSSEICEAYGKLFGREFTPIYKGCTFDRPVSKTVNKPIKIAYAGNLFYGRADILAKLADTIEKLNANGVCATLQIYTGAEITPDIDRKLNRTGHSKIMGRRSYEEIKDILHDADIVLHVESFEQKQIDYVHYSFSTKIIDCLQSGSVAMGIGPAGIASIEYIRGIPGAVVVDNLNELETTLRKVLLEGENLLKRAESIRAFAVERHDIAEVQRKLHQDFEMLI